jgi:hypothetical protein
MAGVMNDLRGVGTTGRQSGGSEELNSTGEPARRAADHRSALRREDVTAVSDRKSEVSFAKAKRKDDERRWLAAGKSDACGAL